MSPAIHELHTRRILDRVAEHERVSQRSLARDLGIALGLTNLLVKRLAANGWIRIVRTQPNQSRYLLTPAGRAQQAQLSRAFLVSRVRSYSEARDRIQQRLEVMMATAEGRRCRAIVMHGSGDAAEVAWVCLQRTALKLVGVVDDTCVGRDFFGHVIQPSARLTADRCNAVRYDRILVVASDAPPDAPNQTPLFFERLGVPRHRLFWLDESLAPGPAAGC